MNGFARIGKLVWKWSWLATLPAAIFFLHWALATGERYWDFGVRHDSAPFHADLLKVGRMELAHRVETAKSWLSLKREAEKLPLRAIDLFIREADEARLDARLPYSGREYVKAELLYPDGSLNPVKVKYRGDFAQHWGYYKKSIRVKAKKKRLFEGLRAFNLVVPKFPELLNNHLGYRLARLMGLMAPRSEMVYLRINGENRGIHLLVEQIEELTLREAKRMPGDLYAGELVARDAYKGIDNRVFEHPMLWEKIAVNNHYPEDSRKPLEALTALLSRRGSPEAHERLWGMLNGEMWGRFALFEILTQSIHYNAFHNWRLYYDPVRSSFEPVVWDPNAWVPFPLLREAERPFSDMLLLSEMHDFLVRDHRFLLARHEAAEDFFRRGLDAAFMETLDETVAAVKKAVSRDTFMVYDFEFVTPEESRKALDAFASAVRRVFARVKTIYLEGDGRVRYGLGERGEIRLSVDGRRPVRELRLDFSRALDAGITAEIACWTEDGRIEADVSGAVALRGASLEVRTPLLARHLPVSVGNYLEERGLRVKPAYYELTFGGIPRDNPLEDLFVARGDGNFERAERGPVDKVSFEDAYGIVLARPAKKDPVWRGSVVVEGTRFLRDDLRIEAGTTVFLKPGASLVLEGRLEARGTKDRPVRFIGFDNASSPWGTVALQGEGADGSRLVHCELSGGSGLKDDLREYSAMLSIHDVRDVLVEHCSFRSNLIVDDMVRGVYSEIRFRDCVFEDALFDALDLDVCTAVVEDCRFFRSGNDALDLMTSKVVVKGSVLQGSGDKGISVGEGAVLFAVNDRILANHIGVQVKDASEVLVYNADFLDNRKAVDAYAKNWRYGKGGVVRLCKSYLARNESAFSADKRSNIAVYDSCVRDGSGPSERVALHETAGGLCDRKAKTDSSWGFSEGGKFREDFFERHWEEARPETRGCRTAFVEAYRRKR